MGRFKNLITGIGLASILYSTSGFSQTAIRNANGKIINCVRTYEQGGVQYCVGEDGITYKSAFQSQTTSKTQNSSNSNSNSGDYLLIGAGVVGGILLLNELFKPRNKPSPTYSAPYNYTPPEPEKEEVVKKTPTFYDYFSPNTSGSKENFSEGAWWKNTNSDKKRIEVIPPWDESEWWKENEQEKAKAEETARRNSQAFSDFVEKQATSSPETKEWFDKEYAKADAFYKEYFNEKYCANYPESCSNVQKMNKLNKIIGYNAYKFGKDYTPAGSTIEFVEEVDKQGGLSGWWNTQSEKSEKVFGESEEDAPENSWYHGTTQWQKDMKTGLYVVGNTFTPIVKGIENAMDFEEKGMENYWKEEVQRADEFLKQHSSEPELKIIPTEKELEKMLGTDVYTLNAKSNGEINKIIYNSDVAKVIRYKAYQIAREHSEAGSVIKSVEKVDEAKKNEGWW